MLPEKIDHVEKGMGFLKSQRVGRKIIEGILQSYLEQLQDVEDTFEFFKNISIYNAAGIDLERIGRLFDVYRLGRDDESYRQAILAYIASTIPNCSVDGVISACKTYGNTDLVDLWEHYPAHSEVYMGAGFSPDMYSIVKTMTPAGTSVRVLVDDNQDSIILAEEKPSSEVLVNQDGDVYRLENTSGVFEELIVFSLGETIEFFDGQSQFAEEGDNEYNPFAEELFTGVQYDVGNIIDEVGDLLVDEVDNEIIYTDFRFI